jgi:inosose dehydratase
LNTVTVSRPDLRRTLRRPGDALPRASIGTVPILWINTGTGDATTILDEIARTGFEGTQYEAGFPQGERLRNELAGRGLRLAEVYLPIAADENGPRADAMDVALEHLRLLHDAGGEVLCVAIDGSPDRDASAGRAAAPPSPEFTDAAWAGLVAVLHDIADAASALGHPTVFHPHAGTFVETPADVDRLVAATDPARIGISLDVGHDIVGGGDPLATLRALGERVRHIHLKDVDPTVLDGVRAGRYAGLEDAVRDGLFTELGAGTLDLDGVLASLMERDYDGWLMVEQDHSFGRPSESAAIGRRVLASTLRRLGDESAKRAPLEASR